MFKHLTKLFKENFNLDMEESKKPKKEKKAPSPQDIRLEAWRKDTTIYTRERKGIWSAVGDVSEFIYKTNMTEDQAVAYMRELNQNRKNSEF